jgi:saccharopine dehydrogenase-like NADP-dependent oxidoreductase
MKVLIVGSGGVGESTAAIAKRRDPGSDLFEKMVMADRDLAKAQAASKRLGDEKRFPAEQVDAADIDAVVALCKKHDAEMLCSFLPVEFNPFTLQAALKARVHHMDASTTLSVPHPTDPFTTPGVKLGDYQFPRHETWKAAGRLAILGLGMDPGLTDLFAAYAHKHLFDEIDEVHVRDGGDLYIEGYAFAPVFSIWTTIEECLNPPLIWDTSRGGHYTTEPFSAPEAFVFPEGIGPVECVNVEHEEVVLVPRGIPGVKKATFKYALGADFINVLKVLHAVGLDSTKPVTVKGMQVAPRDLVMAVTPDPAKVGARMKGRAIVGTWAIGRQDGAPR